MQWLKCSFLIFQFPPLREGRLTGQQQAQPTPLISIPAPARGATWNTSIRFRSCLFQFPPLREGRPVQHEKANPNYGVFQFPPLREGRLTTGASGGPLCVFQFPPLREGRHEIFLAGRHAGIISIPAPARGATANLNKSVLRNLCEQANSKDACLLFYDM